MKKKIAVIFGISGQDGAYLADFLLKKKYQVIGLTRKKNKINLSRLKKLRIINKIKIIKGTALDKSILKKVIFKKLTEVYFLSGVSDVRESIHDPSSTFNINFIGVKNVLDRIRYINKNIKFFNACSAQIFGNQKKRLNEKSVINPVTPYAQSKASSLWLVKTYREIYNMKCCSAISLNHESPLRSNNFVTKKIIDQAILIKQNKIKYLYLGKINVYRDWGWAPEFVRAYYLMLQRKNIQDYVVGTGTKKSIRDFVYRVFEILKISRSKLRYNDKNFLPELKREVGELIGDISKIKKEIGWKPKVTFEKIIYKMVNNDFF
jgi:GDPmannose 4,6-dehydratase